MYSFYIYTLCIDFIYILYVFCSKQGLLATNLINMQLKALYTSKF